MNCQEIQALKDAYADDELDAVRALEVEGHLGACQNCARLYETSRSLKSMLESSQLYYRSPAQLEKQIKASLHMTAAKRKEGVFLGWLWMKLAPAMAVAALVAFAVTVFWNRPAEIGLAEELTASHIRSLMPGHLTDVMSSDQHNVKPWFTGKLDFSPRVIDLAAQGFPLDGARLDYLNGRPVASLIYHRRKHRINLFSWPAAVTMVHARERAIVRHGYNLVGWTEGGMTYWAVSDLNQDELLEFAHALSHSAK